MKDRVFKVYVEPVKFKKKRMSRREQTYLHFYGRYDLNEKTKEGEPLKTKIPNMEVEDGIMDLAIRNSGTKGAVTKETLDVLRAAGAVTYNVKDKDKEAMDKAAEEELQRELKKQKQFERDVEKLVAARQAEEQQKKADEDDEKAADAEVQEAAAAPPRAIKLSDKLIINLLETLDKEDPRYKKAPFKQPVGHKSQLVQFYKKYDPSKLDTVDGELTKYAGREEELLEKLHKKHKQTYEKKVIDRLQPL